MSVTSKVPSDWQQSTNLSLLFVAADAKGTPQPITSRPAVGNHPEPDKFKGFVVYFGTGKYLEVADNASTGAYDADVLWDLG